MTTTIAKPAGLPVFPPHDDPTGDCLLARLIADNPARAALPWPAGFEGGLAHRLDNDTSGAVLVADDLDDLARLRLLFARGKFTKTYRMIAARDAGWAENTCDRSIAHDRTHGGRMIVQRSPTTPHRGKWYPAHTAFRRIRGRLWEVEIRTGVTHQIRVHAAFLGIPLAGDRRYGGGPSPDEAPEGASMCLHHVGLRGPDGVATTYVPMPPWADDGRAG